MMQKLAIYRRNFRTAILILAALPLFCAEAQESGVSPALVLTASDVMQRNDMLDDGDTAVYDYTIVLIDSRDRQRSRNMRVYRKDYGADSKTLSLFDSPADIRGTTYLNFNWDDAERDDDSWLYLPSLQRVKRIASSDTSDSFMGSDFTYADINGFELDWYDYSFVSESVMIDGVDCWLIESVAKPEYKQRAEQATGYAKIHSWIRKDNFLQARAKFWELRGNRIKYYTASEFAQVEGIWTINRLQVVTTRNEREEHASVLQVNNVSYNRELDDDMFTTEFMQRGLD